MVRPPVLEIVLCIAQKWGAGVSEGGCLCPNPSSSLYCCVMSLCLSFSTCKMGWRSERVAGGSAVCICTPSVALHGSAVTQQSALPPAPPFLLTRLQLSSVPSLLQMFLGLQLQGPQSFWEEGRLLTSSSPICGWRRDGETSDGNHRCTQKLEMGPRGPSLIPPPDARSVQPLEASAEYWLWPQWLEPEPPGLVSKCPVRSLV